MSYYGNIVNPPATVNPASVVTVTTSTQLGNYGNTYMVTASGLTLTLMALNPSVKSATLTIVNDSTGTTVINANGTDTFQIAGVGSSSIYLFAGETVTLTNSGTFWSLATIHFNGMRQMNSSALPSTTDLGPIFVTDLQSIMTFVNTAYYTGYRSINVGDVMYGTTNTARPGTVDAMGGTFNMSSYPGLWAYAQEQGLTVASGSWTSGPGVFAQITGSTFRVPDLQNQFLRFTGTDADTSTAYGLGSYKTFTVQSHTHTSTYNAPYSNLVTGGPSPISDGTYANHTGSYGTAETAPRRTAYIPRLKM